MDDPGCGGGKGPLEAPRRLLGEARGAPGRPFLEAGLLFSAFYLASYAVAAPFGREARSPAFHLAILAQVLPRALLALYVMATSDGLDAFGISALKPRDLFKGLACGLGAGLVALLPAFAFSSVGLANPIFAGAGSGPRASLAALPFVALSSISTGYSEELFFRSYLLRRLRQSGLPRGWAVLASSLLFGGGHAYEGWVGIVSGAILGLYFAWRWESSRNIHEIAIGHGLFDAAVFSVLLYS
jgi:membrane protease YdiL (CAAX protease family)